MTKRGRISARLAMGAFAGSLAAVSLLPSGAAAPAGWDRAVAPALQNLLHVPAYAALVCLSARAFPTAGRLPGALALAAACWVYSAALEAAQAFVPGRIGSTSDLLLNTAGVAAGLGILALAHRRREGQPG